MTTDADSSSAEELLEFVGETDSADALVAGPGSLSWRILIVDDDPDVHQATLFSLGALTLFGRSLQFLHAHSASEARECLLRERDLALILLDVVMETHEAGLMLVDFIRNTVGLTTTRIVLRTGQPGYAPEHETILRYDINDYKTKSELTHHKLLTTVTTAVRSYDQLCMVEAGRKGLELIVRASGSMLETQGIKMFADGVITHLAALLGTEPDGLVCAQGECVNADYTVVAAAGRYTGLIDQPLEQVDNALVRRLLLQVLDSAQNHRGAQETVLYLGQQNGLKMAAYVGTAAPLPALDHRLLEVFSANMSACLRNLALVQQLHTDAYVDALLQVPNRTRFIDQLADHLGTGQPTLAVAMIDVDDFSAINDLMGHAYGDALLHALAVRLPQCLGPDVFVARVAGNAFGLLGPVAALSPECLAQVTQRPLSVFGQPHIVSVTAAIATLDDTVSSGEDWLKNASIALKHAKRHQRGGCTHYLPAMASVARQRAQLLDKLHRAFDAQHLFMTYQPQVDLATGALIGMEALLRWRQEDGQLVPPDQFIPVAEQSGLIVSLGDWVLQTACNDMQRLKKLGLAHCRMAVNVSVVQFQSAGFFDSVLRALARSGLSADELELEITESVAMQGSDAVAGLLGQLRATGIAVAIDDFGTGYSSLSYLEKLPLDRIKIDRAFVNQMGQHSSARIAEMIIQLGHKLNLRVIAEGIEDAQAWQTLRDLGCHDGQGFFMSRPLDFATLSKWLAQRPQSAAQYGVS